MKSSTLQYKIYRSRTDEILYAGILNKTAPTNITLRYAPINSIADTVWRMKISGTNNASSYKDDYCLVIAPDRISHCNEYALFTEKDVEFYINPSKCRIKNKAETSTHSNDLVVQTIRIKDSLTAKITLLENVNLEKDLRWYWINGVSSEIEKEYIIKGYMVSSIDTTLEIIDRDFAGPYPLPPAELEEWFDEESILISHSFSNEFFDLSYNRENRSIAINWKQFYTEFIDPIHFYFAAVAETDIGEVLIDVVDLNFENKTNPNNIQQVMPLFTVDFIAAYQLAASGIVPGKIENIEVLDQEMNKLNKVNYKYVRQINDKSVEKFLPEIYNSYLIAMNKYANGESLTSSEVALIQKVYIRSNEIKISNRIQRKMELKIKGLQKLSVINSRK